MSLREGIQTKINTFIKLCCTIPTINYLYWHARRLSNKWGAQTLLSFARMRKLQKDKLIMGQPLHLLCFVMISFLFIFLNLWVMAGD